MPAIPLHRRNVRGDRDALSTYFGPINGEGAGGDFVALNGSNQASWIPNAAGDATQDITGHFNLATAEYSYKIADEEMVQSWGTGNVALGVGSDLSAIVNYYGPAHNNTFIGNGAGAGITEGDYGTIIGANVTSPDEYCYDLVLIGNGNGNLAFQWGHYVGDETFYVGLGITRKWYEDAGFAVVIGHDALCENHNTYEYLNIYGSVLIGNSVCHGATHDGAAGGFRYSVIIGLLAGQFNSYPVTESVGIGKDVYSYITGSSSYDVSFGYESMMYGQGNYIATLGAKSGYAYSGNNSVLLGYGAGAYQDIDNLLAIGVDTNFMPLIRGNFSTREMQVFGDLGIFDPDTTDSNILAESTFVTHSLWAITGDFWWSVGYTGALYDHVTGVGTLTQLSTNFLSPAVGSAWYKFGYRVEDASYGNKVIAEITTSFASEVIRLNFEEIGYHYVVFKAASSPGNFVISVTSTGSDVNFDNVSLVRLTGGDLYVHGTLEVTGQSLFSDKVKFTQVDGNEYIDSLADGYLDISATTAIRMKSDVSLDDGKNMVFDTTTGTKIGTSTSQKIGFFNATPITQPTEITDELTTISHTAPGTPDYAIQDLTDTGGFGFVTKDEGNTALSVIANLQARVNELEGVLSSLGLLADAD